MDWKTLLGGFNPDLWALLAGVDEKMPKVKPVAPRPPVDWAADTAVEKKPANYGGKRTSQRGYRGEYLEETPPGMREFAGRSASGTRGSYYPLFRQANYADGLPWYQFGLADHERMHHGQYHVAGNLPSTGRTLDLLSGGDRAVSDHMLKKLRGDGYSPEAYPVELPAFSMQRDTDMFSVMNRRQLVHDASKDQRYKNFYRYLDEMRRLNPTTASEWEVYVPRHVRESYVQNHPMPLTPPAAKSIYQHPLNNPYWPW